MVKVFFLHILSMLQELEDMLHKIYDFQSRFWAK